MYFIRAVVLSSRTNRQEQAKGVGTCRRAIFWTNRFRPVGIDVHISRLLKMIGLFCRISSVLQGSFAKETYNFKGPTHRSHPIIGPFLSGHRYGVATVSRIDKIIGFFCRISSLFL